MKLQTKFSLLISLLVIFIVSSVTVFLLIAESRFLVKEMENSRTGMIKSLAQVAKESLIVKDEILLLNYLKLLKNTKGLMYASVSDASGKITAHTDINFLGAIPNDEASLKALKTDQLLVQKYSAGQNEPVLELSLPVYLDKDKAGVARIDFSQKVLNEAVKEMLEVTRRRIFMVALAALFAGLIGAFILTKMMTNPIKKLAEGAEIIGRGKLDHKIEVSSKDELGELADEFNKMSDKLKELDQMKSDFVSSVTHELRSPLLSLRMYIDLFLKGTGGTVTDKQKEYLEIMRDGSARLSRFIDDLLDVAKLERGKMEVVAQQVNLIPIINDTVQLFRVQTDQKNIRFDVLIPGIIPHVLTDPDRMRQVLINLMSNAVKFTPSGGTITLKAELKEASHAAEISITDTGIGIPPDKLDSIFNKFEQVKDAKNTVSGPKGTGLGLAIVKGLLEAQGNTIKVESTLGKGSTFTIGIPLEKK